MAHHSEPALTNGRHSGAKSILEKRKSGRKRLALKIGPGGKPEEEDAVAEDHAPEDGDKENVILVGPLGEANIDYTPANDDEAISDDAASNGGEAEITDAGEDALAATDSAEAAPDADVSATGASGAEPEPSPQPAGAPVLSDPELIAILQQLSTTIDTAHQVLDEATALETSRAASVSAAAVARPAPQPALEDAYEGIEDDAPAVPPPYIKPPKSGGAKGVAFAAIAACLASVGAVAWVFHANPWLIQSAGETPSQPHSEAALATAPVKPAAAPVEPAAIAKPEPQARDAAPASAGPDAPRGAAGAPIPLQIELPQVTEGTEVSLMIQGVPEQGSLSAGRNIGGGVWIVDFADARNLMLTVPPGFGSKQVDIEVTFVKSDGKVPEARLIDVVIDPARPPRSPDGVTQAAGSAGTAPLAAASPLKAQREPAPGGVSPAPTAMAVAAPTATPAPAPEPSPVAPQPAPLPKELEDRLMARGAEMMKTGDIAGARLIYEHAAERGSRAAMTELGKSFDPDHLARLGVLGVKPDKKKAQAWYERASRTADR